MPPVECPKGKMQGPTDAARLLDSARQCDCLQEKRQIIREIMIGITHLPISRDYEVTHNCRIMFDLDGLTTFPEPICKECDIESANYAKGAVSHMCSIHGIDVTVGRAPPTPGGLTEAPARIEALRRAGKTKSAERCERLMTILRPYAHLLCGCGEPYGFCTYSSLRISYPNAIRIITLCGTVFSGGSSPLRASRVNEMTIAELYDVQELLQMIIASQKASE